MLNISDKLHKLPVSPTRQLVPLADAAIARGTKVYKLNIGQPDIDSPEEALNALRTIEDKLFPYTNSAGLMEFRKKLVEYYKKHDIEVGVESVIATLGGTEAVQMAMLICANQGDEILIPEPFYANYATFAANYDQVIVPVPSDIEHNFGLPPIEEFVRRITPRTKAILICNPNNPTGYLYTEEEMQRLGELAKQYNLYLISDEVYREFCYDGRKHISALSLKGVEENVIVVDSVSKRFSMCGVRLGNIVSRNKEVMKGAMKIAQSRLSVPYLAQRVAIAAFDAPQEYYDNVVAEYTSRRNCLVGELNKIEGVYSPMPQGAFYTVARFPVDDCHKFACWLLEEFSYKGATVQLAPARGFYATDGMGAQEARLAYVVGEEELKAACEILREALKVYPGRL
ncbi:MAG: pyridoxal phosphate-dependent aminotransferase [Rikenellaceae bacterium]|nr:pyridoxal phosphate-dependent aminotransferase [Rikenellaceae bacterium]